MEKIPTIKEKFIKLWPFYILQSCFASVILGFILFVIGSKESWVAISAMAGTSFIIFAMPKSVSAQSRNVLGGHLSALICGYLVSHLPLNTYFQIAIVVGIVFFIMVALDFEHPPAAGTAVAVVMNEVDMVVFMVILTVALALTLIHRFCGDKLKDLV
jgi:CBS-domain-containing membrane protein